MKERGIPYRTLSAANYAGGLRKHARNHEPGRLVDLLMIGAFIEARSCERFQALVPRLDGKLREFYAGLAAAESRHCWVYIKLARHTAGAGWAARLALFGKIEAALITDKDRHFRFHSGPLH